MKKIKMEFIVPDYVDSIELADRIIEGIGKFQFEGEDPSKMVSLLGELIIDADIPTLFFSGEEYG